MSQEKLRKHWEVFVKCPANHKQKKSSLLDRFLKMYVKTVRQSLPRSLVSNFAEMRGVSNILANEFMTDIHRICSTAQDDDDTSGLRTYLVSGRGRMILEVQHWIGVDGVSCGKELADLFVSLLPVCCKFPFNMPDYEKQESFDEVDLSPLPDCFHHLSSSSGQKQDSIGQYTYTVDGTVDEEIITGLRKNSSHQVQSRKQMSDSGHQSSDSEIDSSKTESYKSYQQRKQSKKSAETAFKKLTLELGVIPSLFTSESSENESEDDEDCDQHSPLSLCVRLLELTRQLCHMDVRMLPSLKSLSISVLPKLAQILSDLHLNEGKNRPEGWSHDHVIVLGRTLLRVIITLSSYVTLRPNGATILAENGTVTTVLDVARIILKNLETANGKENDETWTALLYASESLEGVLMLLHSIFFCLPPQVNIAQMKSALELMEDFRRSRGFELIEYIIEQCEQSNTFSEEGRPRIASLVRCTSKVINALKKTKVDYVHNVTCLKHRHRKCDFSRFRHHHHDILGLTCSSYINHLFSMSDSCGSVDNLDAHAIDQSKCAIATLSQFMLKLLSSAKSRFCHSQVLLCLEDCGICCCMSPNEVLNTMLNGLDTQTPRKRNHILTVLVKFLLDQCGGSAANATRFDPCQTCVGDKVACSVEQSVDLDRRGGDASDSALSSSETSLPEGRSHWSSKWQVIQQFYYLMQSKNENLAAQVAKHLLRLVSQASDPLKFEIFIQVIQPILQIARSKVTKKTSQSTGSSTDSSTETAFCGIPERVLHYCLHGLPLILQSSDCQREFLQHRSLSNMCQLMEKEALRATILQVFQVLILTSVVDVEKPPKMKSSRYFSGDECGIKQVCRVFLRNILLKDEATNLLKISTVDPKPDTRSTSSSEESIDLLSKLKHDYDVLASSDAQCPKVRTISTLSDDGKNSSASRDLTDISNLHFQRDVWQTCHKMITNSVIYRTLFIEEFSGPDHAYKLLIELLKPEIMQSFFDDKRRCDDELSETTYEVAMSLMESLMGVCLRCADEHSLFHGKRLSVRRLLHRISPLVVACMPSEAEHVDMFLTHLCHCAVTCPVPEEPLNTSSFAVLHLKEDDLSDEDETETSDMDSSSDALITEHGYEADSEAVLDDLKGQTRRLKNIRIPASSQPNLHLTYPEMCTFALKILSSLRSPGRDSLLIHAMQKLTVLAKSNKGNVRLLYNEGVIETILTHFKDVFTCCPALGDMRVECELVLELFSILAQHMFSSRELGLYLKMFCKDQPPTMALLSSLLSLMESAVPQPTHCVLFPATGQISKKPISIETSFTPPDSDSLTSSLKLQDSVQLGQFGYVTSEGINQLSNFKDENEMFVPDGGIGHDSPCVDLQNVSQIAPLRVGLEDMIWKDNQHRFSASMWIHVHGNKDFNKGGNGSKTRRKTVAFRDTLDSISRSEMKKPKSLIDNCLHVMSLGSADFTVEFWVDPSSGSLILRLMHVEQQEQHCLYETFIPRVLRCDKWQHLVVNYEDRIERGNAGGKLTLLANGFQTREIDVSYVLKSGQHQLPVLLYIGHCNGDKDIKASPGTWKVGNIMLFRDCVITKEVAFHLYCLGPSCCTISACDSSDQQAMYKYHICEDLLLKSNVMYDMLTGNMSVPLDTVRESLALVYNPKNVNSFNIYPNIRGTTTSSRSLPGILAGFSQKKPSVNLMLQQPVLVTVEESAHLNNEERVSCEMAVDQSGGVGVFLFLFAKIVESSSCEIAQAKSLQLLFSLLKHSPKHARDFEEMSAYSMVKKVLLSSKCNLGYQILKVLTDACCSEPVIKYNRSTKKWRLLEDSEAIIQDVRIITELLLAWKVWEETDIAVWSLGFQVIEVLIREDHPHTKFNLHQMSCGNVSEKLLLACQERIQDGLPSLPSPICNTIIRIIQRMLGSPPDINLVASICDFLLVVHPAASTYVVNTQHKFFFAQHWASQLTKSESDLHLRLEKLFLTSLPSTSTPSRKWKGDVRSGSHDGVIVGREKTSSEVKRQASVSLPGSPARTRRLSYTGDKQQEDGKLSLKISPKEQEAQPAHVSPISNDGQQGTVWFLSDDEEEHEDAVASGFSVIGSTEVDEVVKSRLASVESDEWELLPSGPLIHDDLFDVEETEKGLVHICAELLNLLAGVVIILPDNLLHKLLGIVLRPETLIVLINHNSVQLRTSIVKLLDVYLHRAENSLPEKVEQFLKIQGFHLLANQLHQHGANRELVEACFTMVFGKPHSLDQDCDPNMLSELPAIKQLAIIPIMALLEKIVPEPTLCHNTLCLLCQLFESVPVLAGVMMENGLVEVLCNVLDTISKQQPKSVAHGVLDEYEVLVGDVAHLMSLIASRAVGLSGVGSYQQFEDMMMLLNSLEYVYLGHHANQSKENYAKSVEIIRRLQCLIAESVLEFIQTTCELNIIPRRTSIMDTLLQRQTSQKPQIRRAVSTSAVRDQMMAYKPKDPELYITEAERVAQLRRGSLAVHDNFLPDVYSIDEDDVVPAPSVLVIDPSRRRSSLAAMDQFPRSLDRSRTHGQASESELSERFKKVVIMGVNFVNFSVGIETGQSVIEGKLAQLFEETESCVPGTFVYQKQHERHLLAFLMTAMLKSLEKSRGMKNTWSAILRSSRDVIRIQFSRLLFHMLNPDTNLDQRLYAIQLVTSSKDAKLPELMKLVCNTVSTGSKIMTCTSDLLLNHYNELRSQQKDIVDRFSAMMKTCGFSPPKMDTKKERNFVKMNVQDDLKVWASEKDKTRQIWIEKRESCLQRILQKSEGSVRQMSVNAMEVTQNVVNNQNMERKKFIEHVKMEMTSGIQVKKEWQQLIQQLTHERAVWHDRESYPQSWQLDPTEGPCRVRKRLQRCHLGIDADKLKPNEKHKLETESRESPLSYLFDDDHQTSDSAALIYRLHTNEKIHHTCRSTSVTPSSETAGELLIGESSMYFVGDEAIMDANYTQLLLGNKDELTMNWPLEEIKEIHKRWYQLNDNAIEIFLTNGKTCLLSLESTKERDILFTHLMKMNLPNLLKVENLQAIQQLWVEGKMTNFEYLTHLNKMGGRSFNDLMQYPVFPFILKDYKSEAIDLECAHMYRDLTKPISVQEKDREEKFVSNFDFLVSEAKKLDPALLSMSPFHMAPYHYGSHYSNSGSVLHFLVRLPPFTKMFLSYQDGHFDIPDRTFHSLATTYRLSSYESTTDVKELIPEFFFLPDFLTNNEGFDFKLRQCGERVEHVHLPPWCRDNPRLFTLIHRQALESTYISSKIHHWIDLVFGFKQQGKAAIDAINVFHPATYFGIDVEGIEDAVKRYAVKTMIKTYGQTPKQLFKTAHTDCNFPGGRDSVSSPETSSQVPVSGGPDGAAEKKLPIPGVYGLKWGYYVGSPDCDPPSVIWREDYGSSVSSVVALPTGEVFGLAPDSCLLVMYSKEKGVVAMNTTDVLWASIISWGHPDNILRIKNKKDQPPANFIHWTAEEKVTCCASVPDCKLLFVGGTSGVVTVFNTRYHSAKQSELQVTSYRQCLYGHSGPITALHVCKPFSILVSASQDGTSIIWDLNRLSYVCSISSHSSAVTALAVSDTMGDVATVSHKGSGESQLCLHDVNGRLVESIINIEKILCLAFSGAQEGRSINVIAGGLDNGAVRLWNSWNLVPVRDLVDPKIECPIVSLTFSHDSQRLFIADSKGLVAAWENQCPSKVKPLKVLNFL